VPEPAPPAPEIVRVPWSEIAGRPIRTLTRGEPVRVTLRWRDGEASQVNGVVGAWAPSAAQVTWKWCGALRVDWLPLADVHRRGGRPVHRPADPASGTPPLRPPAG
jgi:hypothetical protein